MWSSLLIPLTACCFLISAVGAQVFPVSNTYGQLQHILETDKYRLLWTASIDEIHFVMQAQVTGWVSIGWSPVALTGTMEGADIVMGNYDMGSSTPATVQDFIAEQHAVAPRRDTTFSGGTNDVSQSGGEEVDGWTTIYFTKDRVTSDSNDSPLLINDEIHLIFGYTTSSDGFSVQHDIRGHASLEFSSTFGEDGFPLRPQRYTHSQVVSDTVKLSWVGDSQNIHLFVQVETSGWVGVAILEDGTSAADVVFGSATTTQGSSSVTDRYTADIANFPSVIDTDGGSETTLYDDECVEEGGWTTLRFSRLRATSDAADVDLLETVATSFLIGSGGSDDIVSAVLSWSSDPPSTSWDSQSVTLESEEAGGGGNTGDIVYTAATEYRTINGVGNNVANPTWGAEGTAYRRASPADFDDGIDVPSGPTRPGAREISNEIFSRVSRAAPRAVSDLTPYWGQFVTHDIAMTGGSDESFPIPIPTGDPFFDREGAGNVEMGFGRSAAMAGTGAGTGIPREIANFQTSFMDGSVVYGQTEERATKLRTMEGGKLITDENDLLPRGNFTQGACPFPMAAERVDPTTMRRAGDARANENPVLFALQTLFVREHNRWCDVLAAANPEWATDDELMYQEARRRNIALLQKVTLFEYLPALTGSPLDAYTVYDPELDPSVELFFNDASFRYGHSEMNTVLRRRDASGNTIAEGDMLLREVLFGGVGGHVDGQLEPVLRGVMFERPQGVDLTMVSDLRNFLFGFPTGTTNGASDLAARSIQRGREHGLSTYNAVREAFGLSRRTSWAEFTSNAEEAALLEKLYATPDDVDAYVGGLVEDSVTGSMLGELYQKSVREMWRTLRDGDRFWFENNQFSQPELQELLDTRISDIMRRNTDLGSEIPDNPFFQMDAADIQWDLGTEDTLDGFPTTEYEYEDTVYLDARRYKLMYTTHLRFVEFMCVVRTTGWVGIGFNPNQLGVMEGGDIVIGRMDGGSASVRDYTAYMRVGLPREDVSLAGGADNVVEGAELWQEDGWTFMRFSKPRVTSDPWDRELSALDTNLVMYAFRTEDSSLLYHGQNVGHQHIDFPIGQLPCTEQDCGEFAECDVDTGACSCESGYQPAPAVVSALLQRVGGVIIQPEEYVCVVELASSEEQRVFWTLALAFSLASTYRISLVMREYIVNPATRSPVSLSYLAVVAPDFVLSVVYLPFYFTNLLRGSAVDDTSCKVIAFITYGVVIATFTGPPIVAYVTLKHFQKVVALDRSAKPPVRKGTLATLLALPWVFGVVLAIAVLSEDKLGSFRGLYCYASDSTHVLTGGLTLALMLLSCFVSSVLYASVAVIVKKANMKEAVHLLVLKRGAKLISAMFCTWFLFCVTGFMNLIETPPPIWLESAGALIIMLQPLIDSHMILNAPNIRRAYLKRQEKRAGVTGVTGSDHKSHATRVPKTGSGGDSNQRGHGTAVVHPTGTANKYNASDNVGGADGKPPEFHNLDD